MSEPVPAAGPVVTGSAPTEPSVPPSAVAAGEAALTRAVETYVRHGYRVVLLGPRRAVLERPQQLRIPLNLALTLITGGVWLAILAVRMLGRPVDRVELTVDDHGLLVPEFS